MFWLPCSSWYRWCSCGAHSMECASVRKKKARRQQLPEFAIKHQKARLLGGLFVLVTFQRGMGVGSVRGTVSGFSGGCPTDSFIFSFTFLASFSTSSALR